MINPRKEMALKNFAIAVLGLLLILQAVMVNDLSKKLMEAREPEQPQMGLDGEFVTYRFENPSESLVKAIYDDYWGTKDGWVLCRIYSGSSKKEGWSYIEAGVCRIVDIKAREEQMFGWGHIQKKLHPSEWSWRTPDA